MNVEDFLLHVQWLTGSPVKEVTKLDKELLSQALADDNREINFSQFNELLLLVNKNRLEDPFFNYFFVGDGESGRCKIAEIPGAVERFQHTAMLRYGNFIYAYRTLSRKRTTPDLVEAIGDHARNPACLLKKITQRQPRVVEIKPIARDRTYLLGYLSAGQAVRELARAQKLIHLIQTEGSESLEKLSEVITENVSTEEASVLSTLVERWASHNDPSTINELESQLQADLSKLKALDTATMEVQKQGEGNTDIYLTWDHMDVYFATSMRKKWEYEQLHDFVQTLMNTDVIKPLSLRYFDPTQSFESNRINKGLVEALMLKRATCTVYSIQDTDTFGKDSELAATLAQGKPVIAFAPEINVEERAQQLMSTDPASLRDRLLFVQNADELFGSGEADSGPLETVEIQLGIVLEKTMWKSIPSSDLNKEFRATCGADLEAFCTLIAESEINTYNRRAETLKLTHPLGIQVHLETGVANGVLVARDVETCAELVRRIVLNEMEFDVTDDDETNCWLLKERLTGSIYRVVTKNRKLTNCFWNYYGEN